MSSLPINLRCEYLTNPLGLGERRPRLSWEIADDRRGAGQRGYHILVSTSPERLAADEGDLWDSGGVDSAATAQIVYAGVALVSRQRVYWKVRVTDQDGARSPWSATAWWEMGLLEEGDWQGQWISYAPNEPELIPRPAYYFRTDVMPHGAVAQARAYVTARGVYELWVNGERVGDAVFAPGWTDYRQRLYVQAYDLTSRLQAGANALGLVLGEGWYCGRLGWAGNLNFYGNAPAVYCQVEITYADGTRETVVSDAHWQCGKGPILASGFLLGESYDARRALPGWCAPGFDAGWRAPLAAPRDAVPFCFASYPPVRPMQELTPVEISKVDDDLYIFDLGQNIVGRVRLRVSGAPGEQITLRYGEMRYPDGLLYTENLRSARSTDAYRLRGGGEEEYEPHFTFHGFRYVEVRGLPAPPTAETITGIVLHSDAPTAGRFACSDPLVNQLYSNIVWGQRGNFLEVPTDCPQRDERLGWMGDAQVFARTACFNMDLAAFYSKWMTDVNDAQFNGIFPLIAPDIMPKSAEEATARKFTWDIAYDGMAAWGDAGVIVPWVVYHYYGDTRLLERCLPHMAAWIEYLRGRSTELISPAEGFGDWLSIQADTPKDVLATAFFAHVTDLTAQAAAVLGHVEEAARFRQLFADICAAFTRAFVDAEGRIHGDTQTGYVLALHFNLLPIALRAKAAAHLAADIRARGNHLSSGFVGISYLQYALTAAGYPDLAYALLEQQTFPSWLYPVLQGATTIWERWDGYTQKGFQDPSMNSFNHYSLGSVGEWLVSTVAGITPDRPGFTHFLLAPHPGGSLTWAEATYHAQPGEIRVRWERAGDDLALQCTIPPNTSATICLPSADAAAVQERGVPLADVPGISAVRVDGGSVRCEATAGQYVFSIAVG